KKRPYSCFCGENFIRHSHLTRHQLCHTGEKAFECPVCERRYARKDLLQRHLRDVHDKVL
ncbi:uncharacterized protein BDR25DRAFT_157717, partial [Lindgomyces ingoldianus]